MDVPITGIFIAQQINFNKGAIGYGHVYIEEDVFNGGISKIYRGCGFYKSHIYHSNDLIRIIIISYLPLTFFTKHHRKEKQFRGLIYNLEYSCITTVESLIFVIKS